MMNFGNQLIILNLDQLTTEIVAVSLRDTHVMAV